MLIVFIIIIIFIDMLKFTLKQLFNFRSQLHYLKIESIKTKISQ